MRARALVIVVLLVSYGAVGARQPAVRMTATLPLPSQQIADALGIASIDRSHFVLDVVRTLFALGLAEGDVRQRAKLRELLLQPSPLKGEAVPLPLDVAIWRETLLPRQVPDDQILAAILSDRSTALLYHGLAGLDDDTLAWLGPERDTLRHLARHAGAFSVFGPSVRVQAGKIIVPGGPDAEPLWQALVGADPAKPAAFVRKLFDDESGHLAWFYDSIAQLDEARLRFALGAQLPASSRVDRARALLEAFTQGGSEWRPEAQPFSRRPLDPALTLAVIAVDANGTLIGPSQRGFWERVFSESDVVQGAKPTREAQPAGDTAAIDAAWLLSRIHRVPVDVGRRRLEAFLFAQRVFGDVAAADPLVATALRAHMAFPALMLTLERAGVTTAAIMASAAARATALNDIGDDSKQRLAFLQFQATLAILERMARSGGLPRADAAALIAGLAHVDSSRNGYDGKLGAWIRTSLLPKLPPAAAETPDAAEDAVLAALAGANAGDALQRVVEWEGRTFRVNPGRADLQRLQRIRQRQGGLALGAALEQAQAQSPKAGAAAAERALADVLTSIVYAASLGDPEGPALGGGNVAIRHDLGATGSLAGRAAWRMPTEGHSAKGWHVTGSLLGLDVALARMSLRRLDSTEMPPEPRLVSAERQTAALSVALLNPTLLTDTTRDEIAAALARGRERLERLDSNRREIEQVARDAGLSAWRREALAWTVAHDREQLPSQLSLLEIMWLGQPRTSAAVSLDGWGAAMFPLNGCVCLAMPRAQPWEALIGRPSLGLLATRGADVSILVADTLATLKMPAEIAPGVIAYAMQEVVDQARPAHFDDWPEFSRAASAVSRDRLVDYIAAQAAGGPLLPVRSDASKRE
jgi:hypothetical protein